MKQIKLTLFLALLCCSARGHSAEPAPGAEPQKNHVPLPASYQIRSKKFGELLRPENANGANGTPIVLYSAQPWKCMTWKLAPVGDAVFSLQNHSTQGRGAPLGRPGEPVFSLQNHFTSKTFSAETSSLTTTQRVVQVPFAKDAAQRPGWRFAKLADGSYKIADAKTGEVLTATKTADGYSVRIVLQPWRDSDEQKWELTEIDPGKLTM